MLPSYRAVLHDRPQQLHSCPAGQRADGLRPPGEALHHACMLELKTHSLRSVMIHRCSPAAEDHPSMPALPTQPEAADGLKCAS